MTEQAHNGGAGRPPLVEFIAGCIGIVAHFAFFMTALLSDVLSRATVTWLLAGTLTAAFLAGGVDRRAPHLEGSWTMTEHAPHGESRTPPGPIVPPLVPGHLGQPSYEKCASLAALVGLCDHYGWPVPATISPGFANRLRDWVKREVERGNLDKLVERAGS